LYATPSAANGTRDTGLRLALIADTHGNLVSLAAVLREVDWEGIDQIVSCQGCGFVEKRRKSRLSFVWRRSRRSASIRLLQKASTMNCPITGPV